MTNQELVATLKQLPPDAHIQLVWQNDSVALVAADSEKLISFLMYSKKR